jgi:hypothetical protein
MSKRNFHDTPSRQIGEKGKKDEASGRTDGAASGGGKKKGKNIDGCPRPPRNSLDN